MFCKKCGAELPIGASECPKCGKAVETIMVAEEPKTESVATSAPVTAEPAASSRKKAKPDKLLLPLALLVVSGAGLVYLYLSNTFSSILSWFTSTGEQKHLRPEINTGTDPIELLGNIGAIAVTVLLVILALAGLFILFRRLGRKLSRKD
ncbi:MAG: zinc ribbon domain-containing protein [Clostridia bacterium]|nr:zinc ribbon domain-containing protein [Clostridia bacterium]